MKHLITAAAALLAATACAGAAQGHEARSDAPGYAAEDVACDLAVRRTRHGAEFTGRAYAFGPVEGAYELVLTKRDSGGSSDILQSGDFALDADDEVVLGVAELSLEPGARGRARLTLWSDGEEICRAVRRL